MSGKHRKYDADFWPSQEALIVRLYATTQLSYSEIARQVGHGATLLDIAGQVRRLIRNDKVCRRRDDVSVTSIAAADHRRSHATFIAPPPSRAPRPLPAGVLGAFEGSGAKVYTFDALPACGCRWPIGDGFCGERIEAGVKRPYCDRHASLSRPSRVAS